MSTFRSFLPEDDLQPADDHPSAPPPLPPSAGGGPDEPEGPILGPGLPTFQEGLIAGLDNNQWKKDLLTQLGKDLRKFAEDLGQSSFVLDNWIDENFDVLMHYLYTNNFVADIPDFKKEFPWEIGQDVAQPGAAGEAFTVQGKLNPFNVEGLTKIYELSLLWIDSQIPGFQQARAASSSGRGSGRRGPSAQDIRNMFDEDELTNAVSQMWGQTLLQDAPDARRIAKDYIDEMVKHRGQKDIDFATFVNQRIEGTGRFQAMYKDKDPGITPLQYITPYLQTAMAGMGGAAGASEVAARGAMLGSDPSTFAARVRRTDEVRNSSTFIGGLEQRLRSLNNVLRG